MGLASCQAQSTVSSAALRYAAVLLACFAHCRFSGLRDASVELQELEAFQKEIHAHTEADEEELGTHRARARAC
jgi:hypothetical protein